MHEHIRQEPPRLVPLVRIVNEYLCDRSRRVSVSLRGIVAEEYDFHERYEDHADGWWPAGVLLLVGAVCVREVGLAMGF